MASGCGGWSEQVVEMRRTVGKKRRIGKEKDEEEGVCVGCVKCDV